MIAGAALAGLFAGSAQAATSSTNVNGIHNGQAGYTLADAKDEKAKDVHSCAGKNSCKGNGGCKTGDNGCKGKNSCKGKGGCATDKK